MVITIAYLDPNDYKAKILEVVKDEAGRDLIIEGNVSFNYYPWLGLEIEGMILSDAKGFGAESFLKKNNKRPCQINVPTPKKPEMDTLVLHEATINLTRDAKGVSNWDALVNSSTEKKRSNDQAMPLTASVLGRIDIKNLSIKWQDKQQGVKYKITNVNIAIDKLKLGEPIDISAGLNVTVSKPALSSALRLNLRVQLPMKMVTMY